MPDGGRIPTDARDYFRGNEKRVGRLERRPVHMSPDDLLGPGLAAQAVQIVDWGSEEALTNGFFYTAPGAVDTPDDMLSWTGQVIAKDDGTGMQQLWNTDGPTPQSWMRTYATVYDTNLRTVEVEPFVPTTDPDTAPAKADMIGDGSLTDGSTTSGFSARVYNNVGGVSEYGYLTTPIPAEPIANPVLVLKAMVWTQDPDYTSFFVDIIDEDDVVWLSKEVGVPSVDDVHDLVVDFPEVTSYTDGSFFLRVWRGDFTDSPVGGTSGVDIYEFFLQEETPSLTGNPEFTDWKRFATPSGLIDTGELHPDVVDQIENPAGVVVTASTQILASPAGGGTTTPATATVTGAATNTTIAAWDYSVDGGAFSGTVPTGVSRTGNVVTITGATMTARTIAVRATAATGVSDTVTVAKAYDGAGGTGPAGTGITGTTVTYQVGNSGTTAPTGTWQSTPQATTTGQFLWTRTVTSYSDATSSTAYSVAAHGSTGNTGTAGVGVSSTAVTYQVHSNGTTAPTGTWQSTPQATTPGQFLWTRTIITYTNATTSTAYSVAAHGSTGAAGRGISSTAVTYQVGSSGTVAPVGTWQSSPQATTPGQFLWTRTITTYTDATTSTGYSVAAHGSTGNTGVGVSSTAVTYQVHSSGTTAPTGTWQSTPQATTTGQFLWTRTVTTYTDASTSTGYAVAAHGATGADAYTVLLTNEAHVFPAGVSAAIAGSTTSAVLAYKGATQFAATIGTITGQVTGLTTSIQNNGTTTAQITVTVTTSLTTRSGTLTVPITVNGVSFTKTFTWSLGLTGAQGPNGVLTDGNPPASAPTVTFIGGIGSLFFRWTEVPNADPVTYRLHVRDGSAPTTDGTYEVASGVGITNAAVRKLKDGTPIVADGSVTYYGIVTAEDDDSTPPTGVQASTAVSGVPAQVTSDDIATGAVTTDLLVFNDGWGINLNGEVITGATVQTRSETDRGVKIGRVEGATNYDEALIVFDEFGKAFLKAVPGEGMAVIAGKVTANSLTVTGSATEGSSLGGVTEITRALDGSAGALRLTGYTTPPKGAPDVSSGYDTVQFTPDGAWNQRRGWATDGTSYFTARQDIAEKWNADGTKALTKYATLVEPYGVACGGGYVYFLMEVYIFPGGGTRWEVQQRNASDLNLVKTARWNDFDGDRAPTIGFDAATSDVILAWSRPALSGRVRIKRYQMPATNDDPLVTVSSVDTDTALAVDLAGITYGTHDFGGANRYVTTSDGTGHFRPYGASGAELPDEAWQSGMGGKVGFTYAGGQFVSVDTSGLMRIYTGQNKSHPIGHADLTKWVSNTLANGTYETDQSPRAKIVLPKRTKLNVTTSGINTGGSNAPDRVRIYVGVGNADPGRAFMWKQTPDPAVGVTQTAYSSLATTGTNPPATNGFAIAAGTIQRLELADGSAFIDGIGNGTVGTGTFRDSVDARALAVVSALPTIKIISDAGVANQSINSGAWTTITLAVQAHKTGDPTFASSIITLPTAGLYHVMAALLWAASSNLTERGMIVETWVGTDPGVNAATKIIRLGASPSGAGLNPSLTHATDHLFPANSKIRMLGYQNSGGALAVATSTFPAQLGLRRVA